MSGLARRQIAVNLAFTLLKSGFVLLSIRLADMMLTAQMMGLLLLFRRQGSLWSNLVQLGLSQSLLRYYVASDDPAHQARLWSTFLRWMIGATVLCAVVCAVFSAQIAPWLFPGASPAVVVAFGIYVAGLALGFMANSSWLAEFKFVESNIGDWLHGSLLFVICLFLGSHLDVTVFTFLLAVLTISVSAFSLKRFSRFKAYRLDLLSGDWRLTGEVHRYGFTRALTAFTDMATLVIGPWMLRGTPDLAGQLIAAYTVLRIAQTLVLPIAQVLALRANSSLYDAQQEERRLAILCGSIAVIAVLGVWVYYYIGSLAIQLWLPNSNKGVINILDELMPYMPGICFFYALRSHVDIKYLMPWNFLTLCLGLIIFNLFLIDSRGIDLKAITDASKGMFAVFYVYATAAIAAIALKRKK